MKFYLVNVLVISLSVLNLCYAKKFTRCQLAKELTKTKLIKSTFLGTYVYGKRFETRCKLVRELMKVGLPIDVFLGQWVCLIEKSSNRETTALTVKSNGKKFYGLYQIPNQWCREKKRGGGCNIACESLLDDDIRDDTACAVKISESEGFQYWPQWTARCKNDYFITNEIYKCPDLARRRLIRRMNTDMQEIQDNQPTQPQEEPITQSKYNELGVYSEGQD